MKTLIQLSVCAFAFLLTACNQTEQSPATYARELKTLSAINNQADSVKNIPPPNRIAYWKNRLNENTSNAVKAMIEFNLAKNYAPVHIDTAELFINKALQRIDAEDGYLQQKMKIYNGAGNVANAKSRLYEASYYYNKASAIVSADPSVDTVISNKAHILLSASQNNIKLKQYAKAVEQNNLALAIMHGDTATSDLQYRAYSQNFQALLNTTSNADTLLHLIVKMDELLPYCKNPPSARFANDHKSMYYFLKGEHDSAIHYCRQVKAFDENVLARKPFKEAIINVYNTNCNLAMNFIELQRTDSAFHYLQLAENLQNENAEKFDDNNKLFLLTAKKSYYYATGNMQRAYEEAEKISALQTSMLTHANIQSMEELSALYQLKAKDRSIDTLSQSVTRATEKLNRHKLILLSSILATLLAITFASLIYFRQQQRKLIAEKEKISLQQQLLRTQMEPHFIFNTLSSLQSFIRFDEKEEALKYLNHFSRLLRSSLELSRKNTVPLSDEIEALQSYLELQQMRHENKFTYDIALKNNLDADAVSIPPMLIQPFVENSIIHGLQGINHIMQISVALYLKGNILHISISDNGNGMPKSAETNAQNHKSLSGTIAKERLEILAKEHSMHANLEINAKEGRGTTVLLTLPVV